MSHFSSPPVSPSSSPASPATGVSPSISRFVGYDQNHHHGVGVVSCKDVFTELMCSLEGLNFGEANSPVSAASKVQKKNLSWLDSSSSNCEDQQPFVHSPSSATSAGFGSFSSNGRYWSTKLLRNEGKVVVDDVNGVSCPAPDLGWVNELLM